MNLVEIKNLTKVFVPELGPALDKIDASVPKGQIVGVIGPDGAGKTTLIRLIAALLLPTEGQILVEGQDTLTGDAHIHEMTGYMPQKFGLYEDLTVMQNLTLYADLRGVLGQEREARFDKLLAFTDLKRFVDRLAGNLSGGMKQKLGLACALVKKPELLLLDEPSVGVDPLSRRELWQMVFELLQEGISVVWSTAYLDEAERCHTVLLIDKGKLLYYGNPSDLTKRVTGRSYRISEIAEGSKRQLLSELLEKESVIDAVIQGSAIRVVTNKKDPHLTEEGKQEEVAPRFEDAFIDILGGSPKGKSELAATHPMLTFTSDEAIVADGLTKKFGSFTAADNITFTVKRGEIFGLLGPNGAGKSTTFKMLCGLLKPTSGKAVVGGLDLLRCLGQAKLKIGYMAQKFSLYGNLSVLQNLNFFSGVYALTGEKRSKAIQKMVDVFHLEPYLDTSAELLPLGFKQRLSLACATMHQPEIVFLDEPTSGVDPVTRREFWNHINGVVEKGVTVMVTTHFMEEAEYCDRIALIYQGHIIRMGSPDELKAAASSEQNPSPTLEEAFIQTIEAYDQTKK